jgi:hypothetical protein
MKKAVIALVLANHQLGIAMHASVRVMNDGLRRKRLAESRLSA